jgi:hypothetical protein
MITMLTSADKNDKSKLTVPNEPRSTVELLAVQRDGTKNKKPWTDYRPRLCMLSSY